MVGVDDGAAEPAKSCPVKQGRDEEAGRDSQTVRIASQAVR